MLQAEGESGVIRGQVSLFHRADQFVIGQINDGAEPLKFIGALAQADEDLARRGQALTLAGLIERDRRGPGLVLRSFGALEPALEPDAARTYLASGLVWHVGEATARAIVEHFGEGTGEILLHQPERLSEVRGLSANLLPKVRESLARTLPLAAIVGLLVPLGIPLGVCRQIVRRDGSTAVAAITERPWSLVLDFSGVHFRMADQAAFRLGHRPDEEARGVAALRFLIGRQAVRNGHTFLPRDQALEGARTLIGWSPEQLEAIIITLIEHRELVELQVDGLAGLADPTLAAAERRLASFVGRQLASDVPAAMPGQTPGGDAIDQAWSAAGYELGPAGPPRPAITDRLTGRSLAVGEADLDRLEAAGQITFDPTQRAALQGILERHLTILTGAPGTGKTTMIRTLCDLAEAHQLVVALMSFTGKAAKRLSEATGREATTIHRFLRFVPGSGFTGPELEPDLVVVDETSMLDVPLAAELVRWLTAGTRLVLVGDVDQLPAIGPGNVFGDLIASSVIPTYRLTTIHRTEADSGIPLLAAAINAGRRELPYDGRSTYFVAAPDAHEIARRIGGYFRVNHEQAERLQVLAPIKKGPAGTDALNGLIANILRGADAGAPAIRREAYAMMAGDRIIWTVNDYDLGLFNGEIGTLRQVLPNGGARVEFDGVSYELGPDKVVADAFTLAYALTVHRAQGSEFEHLIVALDHGAHPLLYRRLLYTAISRARKKVVVLGQASAVAQAVASHEQHRRYTTLRSLLQTVPA